ncbi:MAG: hypothetical protein JWM02_3679 [Frankiales bacterium]|nr:hypothetical protein [Frankiales bacterium]
MFDKAPDGFTDAQWHVDAIADSGVGYVVDKGWHLRCAWCSFEVTAPTKREAVDAYREHERERVEAFNREQTAQESLVPVTLTVHHWACVWAILAREGATELAAAVRAQASLRATEKAGGQP